ncbi:MAG: class D sortase [Thermoanaerobaculia bacterium]
MPLRKYAVLGAIVSAVALAPRAGAGLSTAPNPLQWTTGRIEIARLGIDAEIHEGDDAATLRVSVGHIPGTALPGEHGNVALAAHRYSHFRALRNVRCGDEIELKTPKGDFRYEVDSIRVVRISQVEVLNPTPEPTLTLVTCFPFDYVGDAPQRLIVRARRVPMSETASRSVAAADPEPGATVLQK